MKSEPTVLQNICGGSLVVTFTCRLVKNNNSLSWYLNGDTHATYNTFSKPFFSSIIMQMDVSITELRPLPGLPDYFDVTSVLSSSTFLLDYFDIRSVECGSELGRSGAIEIHILGIYHQVLFKCL